MPDKLTRGLRRSVAAGLMALLTLLPPAATANGKISLTLRDTEIAEVMDMLSRQERVNILLGPGVDGKVSLNLYDVSLNTAIKSIASAAGYVAEYRDRSYFILKGEDAGKHANGITQLRSYKIQYSDVNAVNGIVSNYLSSFGTSRVLPERQLLIVEDTAPFQQKIKTLLASLDRQPRQILIEAKILQIQLDDSDSLGFDWTKFFEPDNGTGTFGIKGFNGTGTAGLFLSMQNANISVALNALRNDSRVKTLSTPRLLALENQEASVIIGNRLGYKVTTTINLITSETIEFLESGIILKVTPSIDQQDRIMLDIHPEVSDGNLPDGIPQQNTTEVTTQVLVRDGQTVFIGGLINRKSTEAGNRVNGLSDIPVFGRLFGSRSEQVSNTETVVLITPYIVSTDDSEWFAEAADKVDDAEGRLSKEIKRINNDMDSWFYSGASTTAAAAAPLATPPPAAAADGPVLSPEYRDVAPSRSGSWSTDDDVSW